MQKKLRQLQLTLLEILKVIDSFCRENNLHYSLYAGTLLGAVRHHGFIPWDDDLDICMARNEYDRFIELWEKNPPNGYILQNKKTNSKFSQSFTKIRKDHTCFLQKGEIKGEYHHGIFVDVFPVDKSPSCFISSKIFLWNVMQYQLFTREFVPPHGSFLQKIIAKFLLYIVPPKKRKKVRTSIEEKICRYNSNPNLNAVTIETLTAAKTLFSPFMMKEFVELNFEGLSFMCVAQWDEMLQKKFGDYMQLPPESEREWRHHPVILDFEHNVDEIEDAV